MAAAGVVVLSPTAFPGLIKFKITCDAAIATTNVNCGFVPSFVVMWNVTDKDVVTIWSEGMADGTCITWGTAATAVASGGVTPLPQTGGTNHGFSVGTDASVQENAKVFEGFAFH